MVNQNTTTQRVQKKIPGRTGQGTGISQPQMSRTLTYMKDQGWVMSRGKKGRGSRPQFFLARHFLSLSGDVMRGMEETMRWGREG